MNKLTSLLPGAALLLAALLSACSQAPTRPTQADTAAAPSAPAEVEPIYYTVYGEQHCFASTDASQQNDPPSVAASSIWARIRLGFALPEQHNARLDAEFDWYYSHPDYMQRVSRRAQRYIYYVVEQLEAQGMPLELALLPIVESAYDPFAYSHGRASGMWQFIPGTARLYGLKYNWWYDGRRDIIDSTRAAIAYLQKLQAYYDGDWLLALAAYNSGQGTVNKAIRKNRGKKLATDFWSLDLPQETRSYVPKLLALRKLVKNPLRYGHELQAIENAPYFSVVDIQSQLDLAQAAEMAELDIEEIYLLNPGFNRWATAPKGPHRLLVPSSQAALFASNLAQLPAQQRLHWQRYTVKSGDSLLLLAKRFHTDIDTIRQINGIKGNIIRAGKALLIPVAAQQSQHYTLSAEQRREHIQQNRGGQPGQQQIYYTVEPGDSLWTIARAHQVSTRELAHWNGISPRDLLQPGQKLSIWVSEPQTQSRGPSQTGQREAITRKIGYRVRNGDSLARIADRFNLRVGDILRWNQVDPKRYLQPGQHLTLYVDITSGFN